MNKLFDFTRKPGYYDSYINRARDEDDAVNWVDFISGQCGWSPLEKKEEMTVHFGYKEYVIYRRK